MPAMNGPKVYDLEERTFLFAQDVRGFVKTLPRIISNYEDIKQLVRSAGSVGANYIEANDALSAKDRVMRIKIARKEAKETRYWLRLVDVGANQTVIDARAALVQEVVELMNILAAILRKLEAGQPE
jgi:four helix bundle protein